MQRGLLLSLATLFVVFSSNSLGQSVNSGTVTGTVLDPSQMAIPKAAVELRSPVTGYAQTVETDETGTFRMNNVPLNMYEISITATGFGVQRQPLEIVGPAPISLSFTLQMAEVTTTVNVGATLALIDTDPSAHTDADSSAFSKMPTFDPAAGLSSVINNSTGGTAADANGFFHPLGDHAQVSFVIDGQPISDQQSKVFSTQLPPDAVQSMQLITGAPDAQYGDKSSLIVNAVTKSGLGAQPFGSIESYWGSFGTYGENATLGWGTAKLGNFIAINGIRTGHFLDTPEYLPIHDIGNNENIFDRVDWVPDGRDVFHLNIFLARNWFQVPNSYDQLSQDQKQRVLTWNVAPSYQRTFGSNTLLTVNVFSRRDQVNYYASRDPLDDTPATESQNRFLTNYGVKADVNTTHGRHNFKFGTQIQQTRLLENFSLGITSPALVSLFPTLAPYDLLQGGSYFQFHGLGNINQYAFYATDNIRFGDFSIDAGLRDDQYDGLVTKNGIEPRLGLSYLVSRTGTVLRAAYSRTFETPFNENLLLSSATGSGGLAENVFGAKASVPIQPGFRNQFNTGLQQKIGSHLVFDADYFWKYTHNAYDFDVLFNTPITFPIAWHNSKLDGVTGRLSTTSFHGFMGYMTFGHTRARYFPPENGGLIFQGTANVPGVFRIDHDQAYQQTVNLRYQRGKDGPWATFIWRFDSGLVVTGVPDSYYAMEFLTPSQQVDIGLACGGVAATLQSPIRSCGGPVTSTLLTLPQAGTENNDHNPDRVDPRNLFDFATGDDNLFKAEHRKTSLRFTVTNLTNKVALYNFLSTFSGTHFVPPRTYQVSVGYAF
ncbi:MAG TPA: TonB-dependent receptor [Bryobacteraceae bacterium]|nr:TonB-dependent receptor [Bryobacteraceae bacterium]